ncbi:MAG: hypothetical protein KJ573_07020 [Proteobacteria bacterium]|nr:hypothetical protein [Pseudomonadota bacterium]
MTPLLIQSLADTWGIVPRVLIIIFVSLYASQILIDLGLFKKLEFIGRPLVRLGHLPKEAGISFVASFGSVLAGNTMIAGLYHQRRINRLQTLLTALINTTPVYVKETFTYQIPVMIPLLGLKVGLLYFLTFVASGIVKVVFIIAYGRLKLKAPASEINAADPGSAGAGLTENKGRFGELLISSFSRQKKIFFKVGIIFVSTTFLIFLLINSGVVNGLVEYVAPLTRVFGLPPACAIPVSTYMFSPLVGATSIGAMLKDGVLSDLQGITACVLGSLLMLPIFTIRYSFAKYTSIFGLSLGCSILAVSTALGMFSRGAFLLLFLGMD